MENPILEKKRKLEKRDEGKRIRVSEATFKKLEYLKNDWKLNSLNEVIDHGLRDFSDGTGRKKAKRTPTPQKKQKKAEDEEFVGLEGISLLSVLFV